MQEIWIDYLNAIDAKALSLVSLLRWPRTAGE